jgi:hypothetical protein
VPVRTLLATTVGCLAALAVIPGAQAGRHYLPMRNAALVAKTYQHYLNNHGFKERCWRLGTYVVSCRGLTLTNDPAQPWHPWSTQIRKISRTGAERRTWMDGKSLGKPAVDKTFVRFFRISGWN